MRLLLSLSETFLKFHEAEPRIILSSTRPVPVDAGLLNEKVLAHLCWIVLRQCVVRLNQEEVEYTEEAEDGFRLIDHPMGQGKILPCLGWADPSEPRLDVGGESTQSLMTQTACIDHGLEVLQGLS